MTEGRRVTLVLCRPDGTMLGALPPFGVPTMWWQEVSEVVAGARAAFGLDVVVLRLLETSSPVFVEGAAVTYLAETSAASLPPSLAPWTGAALEEQPLRLAWARPGGPDADLAWADDALDAHDTPRTAPAEQVRTWNLSSLWRLPTVDGVAWLKVVPPFFAHEGDVLARLRPGVGPALIAHDGPRVLLEPAPGEDQYGAALPLVLRMVDALVGLQADWLDRTDELLGLGAADWRPAALVPRVADVVERTARELDPDTNAALARLLEELPGRLADVASCGVPDTLVHGDFHAGNVVSDGTVLAVLDWGDCGVGNPLLDQSVLANHLPDPERVVVRERWNRLWRAIVPDCEPERAASLLAPVHPLRMAAVYRMFLDGIEPTERVYHAADPPQCLRDAVTLAG